MYRITIFLLLAITLLGCQPVSPPAAPVAPDTAEDTPTPIAPETAENTPTPVAAPTNTQESTMTLEESLSDPLVDQALEDLAGRLNIAADEIEVVSVEAVTWRDGSLGCPQPGMMYTQALQDGTRIVLSAGDVEYHYHSGGQRPPSLCENPAPQ